jgi:hypothetical protein
MTDPRVDTLALACAKAGVHIDKRPLDTARDTPCESCLPAVRAILAALDGWHLRPDDDDLAYEAGVEDERNANTAEIARLTSERDEAQMEYGDACLTMDEQAVEIARLRPIEEAAGPMLAKRGGHSGACCTFDADGSVIVTPESCKCGPIERALRAALAQPEPEKE